MRKYQNVRVNGDVAQHDSVVLKQGFGVNLQIDQTAAFIVSEYTEGLELSKGEPD